LIPEGLAASTFAPSAVEPYQILDPNGKMASGRRPSMSDDAVVTALRWMILTRELDTWGTKLQRMGRIGLYGPLHGQEASVVGSASALDHQHDWLVPAYREQGAWLLHGLPLETLLAIYMGKLDGGRIPPDLNMLPRQQSVAAQLPHAVGLAWAQTLRKTGAVVMVYCGDGASSEGDFHEACNLAGVLRAPVVFVVQNNAWAISTPTSRQTAASSIAARAPGYGFIGYRVDGNDLFAVHEVSKMAVARARSGEGPTLIENVTYRMGFHNTTDNPNLYRDSAATEAAAQLDPIARIERYLESTGSWNQDRAANLRTEVNSQIAAAIGIASQYRSSEPGDIFEHVYSRPPDRLQRQRAQLEEQTRVGTQ
jgi:pyruvate dehydrogenase E1 component alpha subunit